MKYLILIFIVLCGCSPSNTPKFNIEVFNSNQMYLDLMEEYDMNMDTLMFEDENYVISGSCNGEWGGSIKFKEKKDNSVYACEATCPVSVDKIDNIYYLSTTLAHGNGFSRIFKILEPSSMEKYILPEPELMDDGTLGYYIGDTESKSSLGRTTILDTTQILIISTFPYNKDLFYITTDFKNTWLSRVVNGRFEHLKKILDFEIISYEPMLVHSSNGSRLSVFYNESKRGLIKITGNNIDVVLIEKHNYETNN
ncbi:hypothetical protein [Marinigracilibium pacificum]|uniref:Uncharacterized protein n=1 Tax=Marinigracilibium pacificum TaxID=2729599 RepID=A0A848ITS8_9BACT|nr:hypothetical protein [Marinigracilibium pacificum]NMM47747.1 hypothetical protein [Marinigracilibium pacificum]